MPYPTHNTRRLSRGFTLIELMVVVGIIALLVAIALPAFGAARRAAKTAACTATINTISTGLEMFKSDAQLGGAYPPSLRVKQAASPHQMNSNSDKIDVGGASLLVWALAGADLLGTPGFRNVDGDATNDYYGGWLSDTGTNFASNANQVSGLYAIDTNTNKPAYSRSGPFVDLSKMKTPAKTGTSGTPTFQIPAGPKQPMNSLCFLDSFDQPILYYKANPGAAAMAASGTLVPGGSTSDESTYLVSNQYTAAGIYNMRDNSLITGSGASDGKALDFGAGTDHFTPTDGSKLGDVKAVDYRNGTRPVQRSFQYAVWNPNVSATLQPQREDSYILLSAGADGLFGTSDDVANFPVNQ